MQAEQPLWCTVRNRKKLSTEWSKHKNCHFVSLPGIMPEGVDIVIYEFCGLVVKHIDFKCVDIFSLSAVDLWIIRGQILPHYLMQLTKSKTDQSLFFSSSWQLVPIVQANQPWRLTNHPNVLIHFCETEQTSYFSIPMDLSKFYSTQRVHRALEKLKRHIDTSLICLYRIIDIHNYASLKEKE